jgi:hypothetical protein
LIVVGAGLRFYRLGQWPLAGDEISTLDEVRDVETGAGASNSWVHATSPLSHLSIGLGLRIGGRNALGLRLAPAVFGMIALLALYPLTRKTLGETTALVCLAVLALAPEHVWLSGFGRYYSPLFLCGLLALLGLVLLAANRPGSGIALYVGSMMAGVGFHLTMLMLAPGTLLALLLLSRHCEGRRARVATRTLLVLIVAGVTACFWRLDELRHVYHNVMENFPRLLGYRPAHLVLSLAADLGLGTWLFAIAGAIVAIRRRSRTGLVILVPTAIAIGLGVSASLYVTFGTRYLYAATPGVLLLAAYGVSHVVRAADKPTLKLAALGLLFVPQMPLLASNVLEDSQRYDVIDAAKVVRELYRPGDRILAETHAALDYYTGLRSRELPETVPQLDAALRYSRRTIVVALYQRGELIGTTDANLQRYLDLNLKLERRIFKRRFDSYRFEVRVFLNERDPR